MRLPWPAVAGGVAAVVLGAAGLIRGAVPQSSAASNEASEPIVVTGAYVRPPVPPTPLAAAYFTVYNTTGTPDRLLSVTTGAGATAMLHSVGPGGVMSENTDAVIPAHGKFTLSTGHGHVMIGGIFGTLKPGQTVNIELQFRDAGPIDVVAPVLALGAKPPTGTGPSAQDNHSGAHS